MNKHDIAKYESMPTTAVCYDTAFTAYALKGIEYGIDDYAVIAFTMATGNGLKREWHRVKIEFAPRKDSHFVRIRGRRLYLSDFLRVNV